MNDTFKSLDRTYNQRDIREREGSRARIELAEIDGGRMRGNKRAWEGSEGKGEESKRSSRRLS
jgi:hypothetical protein